MIVKDLLGNEAYVTGASSVRRKKVVNGEHSLSFILLNTRDKETYSMVEEESIIELDGEEYRIKKVTERSEGELSGKTVTCHHTFFDLIDEYQYQILTGTYSLTEAMSFALANTDYTFQVYGTYANQRFEEFGNDNVLSMIQEVLEAYQVEFELEGKKIIFRDAIGTITDTQFRYKYNLKTLSKSIDTSNLSTYIQGYGADGLFLEYTSPTASLYGIRHAEPVRDERYSIPENLLARMQSEIQDVPVISLTVEFVDLRKAGYPYDVAELGDTVYVIYEPMGVDITARILEIDEQLDDDYNIVDSNVTLSNYEGSLATTIEDLGKKKLKDIVDSDGKIRPSALDQAMRDAIEALKDAQTEIEFTDDGLLARSKIDPNQIVLLNSAGLGISKDNLNTIIAAITTNGIVADAGVVGRFKADAIEIGALTLFEAGYDPVEIQGNLTTLEESLNIEQWDQANIINADSYFQWTAGGFIAIDPNNLQNRVKFTSGGIGISTDGGTTYQTAITADGVVARKLVATDDLNEGIWLQSSGLVVDSGGFQRRILDLDDTICVLYDGSDPDPFIKGYGKFVGINVNFYIPSGTYDPGDFLEMEITIPQSESIAIQGILHINAYTTAKEFYPYERIDGRMANNGTTWTKGEELEKFVLRMSPYYTYTSSGFNAPVSIMIMGWR